MKATKPPKRLNPHRSNIAFVGGPQGGLLPNNRWLPVSNRNPPGGNFATRNHRLIGWNCMAGIGALSGARIRRHK